MEKQREVEVKVEEVSTDKRCNRIKEPPTNNPNNELNSPSISLPVGGKLKRHSDFWLDLDIDPWVKEVVKEGYRIPFLSSPPLSLVPKVLNSYKRNKEKLQALKEEVKTLLLKEAIEVV